MPKCLLHFREMKLWLPKIKKEKWIWPALHQFSSLLVCTCFKHQLSCLLKRKLELGQMMAQQLGLPDKYPLDASASKNSKSNNLWNFKLPLFPTIFQLLPDKQLILKLYVPNPITVLYGHQITRWNRSSRENSCPCIVSNEWNYFMLHNALEEDSYQLA